ncbi:MAG: phosphoribosylformylglycinamidine synthase subunit PurL, partial [Nitrospinota bacterium]
MGARPVALLDSLRFGRPESRRTRYLLGGVVAGIAGYGNCVGVPTVGGELLFHPCYEGNILVNVLCAGLVREDRIVRARAQGAGNPLIYLGSLTGRDGIHGAAMASAGFGEEAQSKRPAVQVGDPFKEKLLLEATLELVARGLVLALQDMGAAGLTSSSVEMAARAGSGATLHLDRVPRREGGMTAYEVMLSESQERMLLAAPRGREAEVREVCAKWDLEAVVVGEVNEGELLRVVEGKRTVAELPLAPLVEDAPRYDRPAHPPEGRTRRLSPREVPEAGDPGAALLRLLGHPNLGDRRPIYQQYAHRVRPNTLVRPGADAAVLRVKETRKGLALATDGNGRYCHPDARAGAALAVAEAARNVSCVGATPVALTDCLNFGNPERPSVMWDFREAVEGIARACRALEIPVVSGNVSFYNETKGTDIYPTPIVGVAGLLEDAARRATPGFQREGDLIALLAPWEDVSEDLPHEYLWALHGEEAGPPPALDLPAEAAVQRACRRAVAEGLLHSAHDCSEGGIAVALAESCILAPFREVGAGVRLEGEEDSDALLLFGEAPSRILVSLPPKDRRRVEKLAYEEGVRLLLLGEVAGGLLRIERAGSGKLLEVPVRALRAAWAGALGELMG